MSFWSDTLGYVKRFFNIAQKTDKNAEDVKDLQKQVEGLTDAVKMLAFELQRNRDEIQRLRENEQHEREKLLLRMQIELLKQDRKRLPPHEDDEP